MSSEYSFSVPRVQFMSAEYSLCPQSTVSGSREQFMSLEAQLMFPEYNLSP